MINTYQTCVAPPPLPPRLDKSIPVLIQPQGHSKIFIWFLASVASLHLLFSIAGFIVLYHKDEMAKLQTAVEKGLDEPPPSGPSKSAFFSDGKQKTSHRTMACMKIKRQSQRVEKRRGYLQWDINHSQRRNINIFRNSWLTITESGDYFVFSKVTFSNGDSEHPLASIVKLRQNEAGEESIVMQAYCSLHSQSGAQLCTASQGEVIPLQEGYQLSIWVQDLSQVTYNEKETVFGMYKL